MPFPQPHTTVDNLEDAEFEIIADAAMALPLYKRLLRTTTILRYLLNLAVMTAVVLCIRQYSPAMPIRTLLLLLAFVAMPLVMIHLETTTILPRLLKYLMSRELARKSVGG